MPLIQLEDKLQRTAELTYLQENKQQARYRQCFS